MEPLPNAVSLRVIGQHLIGLGIESFEVNKRGEEFVLSITAGKSGEGAFLKNLFKAAPTQIPNPLRFRTSQIVQTDIENRLNRRQPAAMPDAHDLSTILRVLGDYLDRKASGDFNIACDMESVTINYNEKIENFRMETLYDLGIHMYLRRSNRNRTTRRFPVN